MTRGRLVVAAVASAALGLLLIAALDSIAPGHGTDAPTFGEALWSMRGADIVLQALIMLAAVLGVLLVLRTAPGGWPDE